LAPAAVAVAATLQAARDAREHSNDGADWLESELHPGCLPAPWARSGGR